MCRSRPRPRRRPACLGSGGRRGRSWDRPHESGGQPGALAQADDDLVRVFHHVVVRDHEAPILVDDHPGAEARVRLAERVARRHRLRLIATPGKPLGLDAHDRRRNRRRGHPEQLPTPARSRPLYSTSPAASDAARDRPALPGISRIVREVRNAVNQRGEEREDKEDQQKPAPDRRGCGTGGGSSRPKSCGSNEAIGASLHNKS